MALYRESSTAEGYEVFLKVPRETLGTLTGCYDVESNERRSDIRKARDRTRGGSIEEMDLATPNVADDYGSHGGLSSRKVKRCLGASSATP